MRSFFRGQKTSALRKEEDLGKKKKKSQQSGGFEFAISILWSAALPTTPICFVLREA